MAQITDPHRTARHADDSQKRVTSNGADDTATTLEVQSSFPGSQNINTTDKLVDMVVAGHETSNTLDTSTALQAGVQRADSKPYEQASTTAFHSNRLRTAEPSLGFRIFPVEINYCERYPALAAFEKLIRDYRYDTFLKTDDYTITPERLQYMADCLMFPKGFDVGRFLGEHEACSAWLTELGLDFKIESETEGQDQDRSVAYSTLSLRAIRGARAFTGSSTPITRPAAYTGESVVQGSSRQVLPELYHQPPALDEVFAHPLARHTLLGSLRWMPPLGLTNQVADLESVHTTERSSYPGFVYVVGFSSGARQEGPRGHSKSGSLRELHSDAPSEQFNICMLGALQVSIDELCAFFPLHYTWHGFMERFLGAKYGAGLTARLMVYYRGYNDKIRGNALRQRIEQQKKNHPNKGKDYTPTSNFSTGSWDIKVGNKKTSDCIDNDWNVMSLTNGVVRLPMGEGRRHLTMAIEHARAEGNTDLMLSELPAYIKMYGIGNDLTDMAVYTQHPDVTTRESFQNVVDAADPRRT